MTVTTPHIEVRGLTMAYGDYVIQRDLNFTIKRGDIFVIMGGSGCGKSTLLRQMIGLHQPAKGAILYNGVDYWAASEETQASLRRGFGGRRRDFGRRACRDPRRCGGRRCGRGCVGRRS